MWVKKTPTTWVVTESIGFCGRWCKFAGIYYSNDTNSINAKCVRKGAVFMQKIFLNSEIFVSCRTFLYFSWLEVCTGRKVSKWRKSTENLNNLTCTHTLVRLQTKKCTNFIHLEYWKDKKPEKMSFQLYTNIWEHPFIWTKKLRVRVGVSGIQTIDLFSECFP